MDSNNKQKALRSFKAKIQFLGPDIEESEDEDELKDLGSQTLKLSARIIQNIKDIRRKAKIFDNDFIFNDDVFFVLVIIFIGLG